MKPLLNLVELARLLGRSPATLKRDLRRNPQAVPPLVQLPGTRLLRWREEDVAAWVESYVPSKSKSESKSKEGTHGKVV